MEAMCNSYAAFFSASSACSCFRAFFSFRLFRTIMTPMATQIHRSTTTIIVTARQLKTGQADSSSEPTLSAFSALSSSLIKEVVTLDPNLVEVNETENVLAVGFKIVVVALLEAFSVEVLSVEVRPVLYEPPPIVEAIDSEVATVVVCTCADFDVDLVANDVSRGST